MTSVFHTDYPSGLCAAAALALGTTSTRRGTRERRVARAGKDEVRWHFAANDRPEAPIDVPNSHWLVDEKRGAWRNPFNSRFLWWIMMIDGIPNRPIFTKRTWLEAPFTLSNQQKHDVSMEDPSCLLVMVFPAI